MNKELLAGVSRIVDSVRVTDSNKKLEEYLLGSLRANGLETMVNIVEHKDGYRISEQGNEVAYADVYLDDKDTLVAGLSRMAQGLNGWAINNYAEFAGISREQARVEAERLFAWFADLEAKDGRPVEELKDIKVTDATARRHVGDALPNWKNGKDKGFAPFALESEDFKRVEESDGEYGTQVAYTLSDPKEYHVEEAWFVDDAKNMDREWDEKNPPRWWTYVKFNNKHDWEGEIKGTPDQVADEIREIIEEYFTKEEKHVADAAGTASKLLSARLKEDTSKLLAELAEKEQAVAEFIANWKKSHADNLNGYIKDKEFKKIRRQFLDAADRYAEHIGGLVHKYGPTQY